MGIGAKKTWDDVSNKMYTLRLTSGKWVEGRPVVREGRLVTADEDAIAVEAHRVSRRILQRAAGGA